MSARFTRTDPDIGIPDLVRSLGEDSKRLVRDEMRLAKLEMRESMRDAAKGAMWMGIAFGVGVVALVALTVLLTAVIGRIFGGNYWAGALITGAIELAVALVLIKKGVGSFAGADYTLEETREEAKKTARWVSSEVRSDGHPEPMVASARRVETEHRPGM